MLRKLNTVTKLNQSSQHTRRNKRKVNRNTQVKVRKYHLSEIENKMETGYVHINITKRIPQNQTVFSLSDNAAEGVNNMSICPDGNINAGVTVIIDKHHSTYVDDLERKELHLKDVITTNSDETIGKRKRIEEVKNRYKKS